MACPAVACSNEPASGVLALERALGTGGPALPERPAVAKKRGFGLKGVMWARAGREALGLHWTGW